MGASSAATLIHELREQLEKGRLGLFPGEGMLDSIIDVMVRLLCQKMELIGKIV